MSKEPMDSVSNLPALETRRLTTGYGGKIISSDVNLRLGRGELTAMIGRNGSGKSTLLKTLTGRLAPISGEVFVGGKRVETISRKEMARLVSVVITERADDMMLTARETVELGRHPYTGFLGVLSEADHDVVERSMELTGCKHLGDRDISSLSDGERQKVAIARALAQDTPVMLLDEPFSFIDVAARLELTDLLKKIATENGKTILFSTHDISQAFRYSDRLICFTTDSHVCSMTPGEAVAEGIPDRLFLSDKVRFDPGRLDYVLCRD